MSNRKKRSRKNTSTRARRRESNPLLIGCVLLSGVAGLVYEVVWARQLTLFLGTTTYAHTAVLTAYMAGLSLGSYAIGRRVDRLAHPLRLYATFELGIGLFAAITPWLFPTLQQAYVSAAPEVGLFGWSGYAMRFGLALLALLVPTFLMGGTLPLLIRGTELDPSRVSRSMATLYGVNTLGATIGAFAAGYLLLPELGIRGTIFAAVALNVGVGAAVYLAYPDPPLATLKGQPTKVSHATKAIDCLDPGRARWLLIGFAVSGFAALVYQLVWIRALILVIGGSVYAFSLTLTAFLASIALGSLAYRWFARAFSMGGALRLAAALQLGVSLTALATFGMIGELPDLFLSSDRVRWAENFFAFQFTLFGLCFAIVFVPTLLLGALFPLVTGLWAQSVGTVGRGVGTAYAANASGTILGALCGGLLLLPNLGAERSLFVASGLSVFAASLWWWLGARRGAWQPGGIALAWSLFALGLIVVPNWNREIMQAGVFTMNPKFQGRVGEVLSDAKLLYYKEGIDGVVSVIADGDRRSLRVNGKTDAGTGRDMATQIMLGQLPMFLHPNPQRSLLIGLGSGISAGAVASHGSLETLDIIEISPEVVDASEFFVEENDDVLRDPRTRLVVADARNFMLAGGETYDVIVSEPSNPWLSGVSNLFTRDFFELARGWLAPRGLMVQWFHTYGMSVEDVKCILKTFSSVFPNVTLWRPLSGDLILVGSREPHELDYSRTRRLLSDARVRENLAPVDLKSPVDLVDFLLMTDDYVDSYAEDAPLNTDDRPRIEFSAPSHLYSQTTRPNMHAFLAHLNRRSFEPPIGGLVSVSEGRLRAPFINLLVRTDSAHDAVSGVRARWLVARPEILDPRKLTIRRVNQGFLNWQHGDSNYEVLGQRAAVPSSFAALRGPVGAALVGNVIREGQVGLPGGYRGVWGAGPTASRGSLALALAWQCPFNGESDIRYVALLQFPDPGEQYWGDAAKAFANRMICTAF